MLTHSHDRPVQLTPFVGRTQKLNEILALINDPDCRLLTLVGPGGMGKTRLALETGLRLIDQSYSDGVYFVALQPLTSSEFILSAIADAIGIQFYSGAEQSEQLVDYFRSKALLLILDNFEHLLAGADLVSKLLANAPELNILVTSREVLNLQEEWLYQVSGMRFPESDTSDDLDHYDAVRLFTQCARRVRPDFSPETDRQVVMHICQLVEGMPLALEIVAAWLKRLPLRELASQIEHGLDILESPARNVPTRHRSIRAVFDHSWSLLTEVERDVFMKLSVFRGGFDQEAAKAIAGATINTLSALVDKSLVQVDDSARYDLHELLRQYSEEQLIKTPELATKTCRAHCDYYVHYCLDRDEAIRVYSSAVANAEVNAEIKNIRLACDWMLEHTEQGDQQVVAMLTTIAFLYMKRCSFQEGEKLFAKAAFRLRAVSLSNGFFLSMVMQAWFVALGSQDYLKAVTLLEETLVLASKQGAHWYMSISQSRLSERMIELGNYQRAYDLGLQSIKNTTALHNNPNWRWPVNYQVANLGYISFLMGDFEQARRYSITLCALPRNTPVRMELPMLGIIWVMSNWHRRLIHRPRCCSLITPITPGVLPIKKVLYGR